MFRRRVEDDFSSVDFSMIDFDEKTKSTTPGRKKSETLFASFSASKFASADNLLVSPAATAVSGETDRAVGQRRFGRKKGEVRDSKQKHVAVSAFGMLFNSVLISNDCASDEEYQEPRHIQNKSSGTCGPSRFDQKTTDSECHYGSGSAGRGLSSPSRNRSPRRRPSQSGRQETDTKIENRRRGTERWKASRPNSWSERQGSESFTTTDSGADRPHAISRTPTSPRHRSDKRDSTERRRELRSAETGTNQKEGRGESRKEKSHRKVSKSPRNTPSDRSSSRRETTRSPKRDSSRTECIESPRKKDSRSSGRPQSPRKSSRGSRAQERSLSPRKQSKGSKTSGEISSPRKYSRGLGRRDRSCSPQKQSSTRREDAPRANHESHGSPRKLQRTKSEQKQTTCNHSKNKSGVLRTSSSPIPKSAPSHQLRVPVSFDKSSACENKQEAKRSSSREISGRERPQESCHSPRKLRRPSMAPANERQLTDLGAPSSHSSHSHGMRSTNLGVSSHSSRSRSKSKRQGGRNGHDELVKISSHSSSRRSASRSTDQELSRHSNRSRSSLRRPSLVGNDTTHSFHSAKERSTSKASNGSESGSWGGSSRSPLRRDASVSTPGAPDSLLTKASPSQQSSVTGVPSLNSSFYLSSGGSHRADISQESPVSSVHTTQSSRSFFSAFSGIRREALVKLGVPTSSHAYQSETDDSSICSNGESCGSNPSYPVFQFEVDPQPFH